MIRFRPFSCERGEDAIEDAEPAPADEAIIERLGRPVLLRGVLPLRAVLDDVDDPADYPAIVHPRHAMRQKKMRGNPRHLRFAEKKQIT